MDADLLDLDLMVALRDRMEELRRFINDMSTRHALVRLALMKMSTTTARTAVSLANEVDHAAQAVLGDALGSREHFFELCWTLCPAHMRASAGAEKNVAGLIKCPEGREFWTQRVGRAEEYLSFAAFLLLWRQRFSVYMHTDQRRFLRSLLAQTREEAAEHMDINTSGQLQPDPQAAASRAQHPNAPLHRASSLGAGEEGDEEDESMLVSAMAFSLFLECFGPFSQAHERAMACHRKSWFCGALTRQQSHALLQREANFHPGTFLLRYSTSDPGRIAASFVTSQHTIKDVMVHAHGALGYSFESLSDRKTCDTIPKLVESRPRELRRPLTLSEYERSKLRLCVVEATTVGKAVPAIHDRRKSRRVSAAHRGSKAATATASAADTAAAAAAATTSGGAGAGAEETAPAPASGGDPGVRIVERDGVRRHGVLSVDALPAVGEGDFSVPSFAWPQLERPVCEAMVREHGSGAFLVRRKGADRLVVSVAQGGAVKHCVVERTGNGWTDNPQRYPGGTVRDLLRNLPVRAETAIVPPPAKEEQ